MKYECLKSDFITKDNYDYDLAPYSDIGDTFERASMFSEELDHVSTILPTVYSPTPSIPTISSPQSAATFQPGYFEVYNVAPIPPIDMSTSSQATFISFSFGTGSTDQDQKLAQLSPTVQNYDIKNSHITPAKNSDLKKVETSSLVSIHRQTSHSSCKVLMHVSGRNSYDFICHYDFA